MRLVFLIHSLSTGGAERVTANLANHWANKGWAITIITIAGRSHDYYKLVPSIKRVSLDLANDSTGFVSAILGNLRRLFLIRSAIKQAQPDVAIAMMTQSNILLSMSTLGLRKVITIGSERTHPPQMPLSRAWEALRRHWYGRLTAIVSLTTESGEWLRTNTSGRHIVTIPNSVPWPFPSQDPVVPVALTMRKILLAVGRLSEEKGFHTLIDCFANLAERHLEWDLVILGEGRQRSELEALIERTGLDSRIRLVGQVGNVGDWYQIADLYVMCSRFEGFPNTLAEAMAHGVPSVSFDCDTGPRDIIRHELDGLLIESANAHDLQIALERLMGDDDLRHDYASRATEARHRFSTAVTVEKWERLFLELRDH
jgi:glycosyltransferase involved in cell wall biosynthesis